MRKKIKNKKYKKQNNNNSSSNNKNIVVVEKINIKIRRDAEAVNIL